MSLTVREALEFFDAQVQAVTVLHLEYREQQLESLARLLIKVNTSVFGTKSIDEVKKELLTSISGYLKNVNHKMAVGNAISVQTAGYAIYAIKHQNSVIALDFLADPDILFLGKL